MATTQQINNTRLSGTQEWVFGNSHPGETNADVTIDRTVNGGLNSLTTNDTLFIGIERSFDGGQTWETAAGINAVGGTIVTKGVTDTQEQVAVGIDSVTTFRVTTVASTPVRIAGTIVYS